MSFIVLRVLIGFIISIFLVSPSQTTVTSSLSGLQFNPNVELNFLQ